MAEEQGRVSVRQNRFLSTGDVKPEEDESTWWIPLGIKSDLNTTDVDSRALNSKVDTIKGISQDSFYKINRDLSGFYRTNYPADRLAKLGKSRDLLSTEDKIGLIGDAAALAVSGEGTTSALLALLDGFKREKTICESLGHASALLPPGLGASILTFVFLVSGLRSLHPSRIYALYSLRMKTQRRFLRSLLLK